jgi:hypothetical protein
MKSFLQKYPLFLLLLPLFIVLHIEKDNHDLINYYFVYDEIIFLFAVPLVCYPLSFLITRNYRKAALITLLILIVYYFFGEIKDILKWYFPKTVWQSYTLLLPLALALLVAGIVFIRRSKRKFVRAFLFANVLLLLFIIADLAAIWWNERENQHIAGAPRLTQNYHDSVKPDIYFLIFDSYTSTPTLKQYFNFDNSALDSSLTEKGFRIIPRSKSNYNLTPFSISSQFRFNYLDGVDTSTEYFMRRYLPAIMKVYHSPLLPMMDSLGYTVYNHSIFNFRSLPSTVPVFDIWRSHFLYQQYNLLKKLDRDIGWQFPGLPHLISRNTLHIYGARRDKHDSVTLSHLQQTIREQTEKPKFVYGHLLVPHSPYTFDSAGNKIRPIPLLPPSKDKKAYVDQIIHVNRIMMDLIELIFKSQKRPFVIVLQGDHGYRFYNEQKNLLELSNLSAFYFYNKDYRLLNDSLTNINTFPVIFNTFFGQQLPIRPDHHFFLKHKVVNL